MTKFSELINDSKPVLVDFYADWCGPCRTLAPILLQVASSVEGHAKIIKVNVDKNPVAADHYNVRSVPTMLIFKDGKELWRHSGVMPQQALVEVMEKYY